MSSRKGGGRRPHGFGEGGQDIAFSPPACSSSESTRSITSWFLSLFLEEGAGSEAGEGASSSPHEREKDATLLTFRKGRGEVEGSKVSLRRGYRRERGVCLQLSLVETWWQGGEDGKEEGGEVDGWRWRRKEVRARAK